MHRLLLLGILTLAACVDPHGPLSPDFGNAVNSNVAAQVINPNALVTGAADTDGQRIGDAMNRYRTGKVTRLQPPLEAGKITSVPIVQEK
jgi:type IV pilus biogenesis protein CpaD/CtpE